MKKANKTERGRNEEVVHLKDLIPQKDPKGGKGSPGKAVFGGAPVTPPTDDEDRQASKGRRKK